LDSQVDLEAEHEGVDPNEEHDEQEQPPLLQEESPTSFPNTPYYDEEKNTDSNKYSEENRHGKENQVPNVGWVTTSVGNGTSVIDVELHLIS